MDDMTVSIYCLAAVHRNIFDIAAIEKAQKDSRRSKSKWWAKRIVDQNEFTLAKCNCSVATRLFKIALNTDAPVNFNLTAFPGPARTLPTH
jgi:hypothetical protein